MLPSPETRVEEREARPPERGAGAEEEALGIPVVDKKNPMSLQQEAAQQPDEQQQLAAPLVAPTLQLSTKDAETALPTEAGALSEKHAAGSGGEEETIAPKEAAHLEEASVRDAAACSPVSGSNHRVKPHLAGKVASIAQVVTSGGSAEVKVAQRVVNRSGQKALQGFFSEVFETVTAS
jgi:hypothetical protein